MSAHGNDCKKSSVVSPKEELLYEEGEVVKEKEVGKEEEGGGRVFAWAELVYPETSSSTLRNMDGE